LSVAYWNKMEALEKRMADLESAFSRPAVRPATEHSLSDLHEKVTKLNGEIMALKARMGKAKE
jgi:uncharacterized protein YceH (UPF0502 family)